MREKKYRAWGKIDKKFNYFTLQTLLEGYGTDDISTPEEEYPWICFNDEITEFTGLHDATKWEELSKEEQDKWIEDNHTASEWKGREIYEHDILGWPRHEYKQIVEFTEKYTSITEGHGSYGVETSFGYHFDSWYKLENAKVIGNCFENPELLEAVK